MSCRTSCCKTLVLVLFAMAAMLLQATPAYSQGCLADVDSTIAKHLGGSTCTANDVRLAQAVNPRDAQGNPISTCFAGTSFSFIADFKVVTTATNRENIGFYMRTDGITPTGATCSASDPAHCNSAEFPGTCADNIVSPLHLAGTNTTCTAGSPGCLGSSLYHENAPSNGETAGDTCGDTTSADGNNQFITVAVNNITCPPVGSTFLLPNCTTWWQPTNNVPLCISDPNTGWPFNPAAQAGTTSKCNCSALTIPITPISYSITVTKTPTPLSQVEPGGDFNYDVGMTNTTTTNGPFGNVIIDQVCDNKYGNIATTGACSGGSNTGNSCTSSATCTGGGTCVLPSACPAGSQCSAPNNTPGTTCATNISCSVPHTVASGGSVDPLCTFTGSFTPGTEGSLTDRVTVSGFGNTGQAIPPAVTNFHDAAVTVSEAPATATVTKSLDTHACAIARYKVEVQNTSGTSTDESESLTALADSPYGSITTVHGNVLGTTCGVATNAAGLGTLSGSSGAGTLSATLAPGDKYTCEFDGEFCATLGTHGACTSGLEQMDTVTASLSDDNGEGNPVTVTGSNQLTVDVCFTSSSQ